MINVLLDPTQMPNQSQDQATFDNYWAAVLAALPAFGQQFNAGVANLNSIAAGGAYAIPYIFVANNVSNGGSSGGIISFAKPGGPAGAQDATQVIIDTKQVGGASVAAALNDLNGSTSAVRGTIRLVKQGDASKWARFAVSSYVVAGGGAYGLINVTPLDNSSATPFSDGDSVMLFFQRTGDKGDLGIQAPVLWVRDEKASNASGGASTAGSTVQRTLNTVKKNAITGASLSSNQVTLPAGTYRISFAVPTYATNGHQAWLYNVTDGAVLLAGASDYAPGGGRSAAMNSEVTLSASKVLEVRHYTNSTSANGLGAASTSGQTEVYTELFIEKVA